MGDVRTFADWTPVVAEGDLPDGRPIRVTVGAVDLFLLRSGQRLFALDDRCTHQGGPLHRGRVNADAPQPTVTCPVHGSMFWLTDGRVVRGPASRRQPVYDARIEAGMVEVRERPA